MASFTIEATSACSGGEHVRLRLSVNGTPRAVAETEVDAIMRQITEEEGVILALFMARMTAVGRTKAQTKTALQTGVTVTF